MGGGLRGPFDLHGVLDPARYDALVPPAWRTAVLLPTARSVEVLGHGGPAFFRAFRADPRSPEPDPLDAWTRRQVEALVREDAEEHFDAVPAFYWQRRAGAFADFVVLAQACGLGVPGRLGLLLHPEFGPWLSVRALLLTEKPLNSGEPLSDFAPCRSCSAPCIRACPGEAVSREGFVASRCAQARRADPSGTCGTRCEARRACVLGQEHAYDADAEAFHMAASLSWIRGQGELGDSG